MIGYLIRLNPQVVVWRVLKILKLNSLILFTTRRKFFIPLNETNHKTVPKLKIKSPYINEAVQIKENSFIYSIGSKSKVIDFNITKLDSRDYIFDYLVWYRNWLLDIKEDLCLYEDLIFHTDGISKHPHPISNTLINYLLIYDRLIDNFGEFRVNKFLIQNYNSLVINTEDYTGGNHLLDNYIGLLSLSHFFGYISQYEFWQKKLVKAISQFGIPEDNVSYAKLFLWKIDALSMRLNKIDVLNLLRKRIVAAYPYIESSALPMYNDNYVPIESSTFSDINLNTSRFFYFSNSLGLLVFFLKNGLSTSGNNGHDHDSSASLQVWAKDKCMIGPKGTSHYSHDKARVFFRKRNGGSRFFPDSHNMKFYNSFRAHAMYYPEVVKELGYEKITLGGDVLKFNYSETKEEILLEFELNRDRNYFTFYSDFSWLYDKESAISKSEGIKIFDTYALTCCEAYRYNGLYNKILTKKIGVHFGEKLNISIQK